MKVYLDTNCIVYLVEPNPIWSPKIIARIASIRLAGDELALGDLAKAECFVMPFKTGDKGLESRYRAFFKDPDVHVLGMTDAVCERAARIRGAYPFKLPDCLHLAAAIVHGCSLFLTNDVKLARCTEISVEVLS